MIGLAIAAFLFFWFACFMAWHLSNNALNRGNYIEPHFRDAVFWWATWGLLLPTSITIGVVVIMILVGIGSYSSTRSAVGRRAEIDRMIAEEDREIERLTNLTSLESTDFERELRRRLRDSVF